MSRLFYLSFRRTEEPAEPGTVFGDQLLATFIGTPVQTLGQALNHFNDEALKRAKRIANGEVPNVPEVIFDNCVAYIDKPLEDKNRFTVSQTDSGFIIWISDGPDRYVLVD
ncbi:hypothetical protein D3C75_224270 [compost metagenome]